MGRIPARRLIVASLAVVLVSGAAYLALGVLSTEPSAQQRPGHIGCPPGSHGKPWSADAGRKLRDALSKRASAVNEDDARPLDERALTERRK